MKIIDDIESLILGLAEQQAIPDDSWKPVWERLKLELLTSLPMKVLTSLPMKVPAFAESSNGRYDVMLYDGFDNKWMKVGTNLSRAEAISLWNEKTDSGRKATAYDDIDYYKIVPMRQ